MSSSGLLIRTNGAISDRTAARLIVTRRETETGTYRAIGFLDKLNDHSYEFVYLQSAVQRRSFVPLIGFSDPQRRYHSRRLFPSFAERVIGAKRPDRPEYLASLHLDETADSWEILSASGGYREGDAIELIGLPTFDELTGRTHARFLAHGVRYRGPLANDRISKLKPGDALRLEREPDNTTNRAAIKILASAVHLGYVPDPLLGYVGAVLDGGVARVTVVQANPPETNPHLRLLLALDGVIAGEFPFNSREWLTAAP